LSFEGVFTQIFYPVWGKKDDFARRRTDYSRNLKFSPGHLAQLISLSN
jgi:hypothetical protein